MFERNVFLERGLTLRDKEQAYRYFPAHISDLDINIVCMVWVISRQFQDCRYVARMLE
jgi:hypothetical protein